MYSLKVTMTEVWSHLQGFLAYVFKQFDEKPGRYGKNKHFSGELYDVKGVDTLQCAEHNGLTIPNIYTLI